MVNTNFKIISREMLTTYLLTHTFHHTLFDWLKFIWDPPNQSKRVC